MEQKKVIADVWYEKKWLVVILCIFFFPVGFYALWKNSSVPKTTKIGVPVIFTIFIIAVLNIGPEKKASNKIDPGTSVPVKPAAIPKYEVVNVESIHEDIYCKITMDDMYSREELIE